MQLAGSLVGAASVPLWPLDLLAASEADTEADRQTGLEAQLGGREGAG